MATARTCGSEKQFRRRVYGPFRGTWLYDVVIRALGKELPFALPAIACRTLLKRAQFHYSLTENQPAAPVFFPNTDPDQSPRAKFPTIACLRARRGEAIRLQRSDILPSAVRNRMEVFAWVSVNIFRIVNELPRGAGQIRLNSRRQYWSTANLYLDGELLRNRR